MTKEELLEEVKRRYPIGTIVASLAPGYLNLHMKVLKHNNINTHSSDIYLDGDYYNDKNYNPCVYHNGQWAKIISKPINKQFIEIY